MSASVSGRSVRSRERDISGDTTENDGFTQTVFEDPFDDDLGWEVDGDATSGAWIRGNPVQTMNFAELAQPDDCGAGNSCYFTGQNPDSIVDEADVTGGSTTLTSPEFDLDGFAAASVTLQRFFYKSSNETGTELRVELLTPDAEEPSGYRVFVLEQLAAPAAVGDANMWTPKEYVGCGLPMVAAQYVNSRSRIWIFSLSTSRGAPFSNTGIFALSKLTLPIATVMSRPSSLISVCT